VFGELFARQDWGGDLAVLDSPEFCIKDATELILVTTVLAQVREGYNFAVRPTRGLRGKELGAASNQSVVETQEDTGNLIYAGYPYDPYK
jgi:hypothetical protein